MSEEKPNFKVTDRRLFNPDGSPRFVESDEEPATIAPDAATAPTTPTVVAGGGDGGATSNAAPHVETGAAALPNSAGATGGAATGAPPEDDELANGDPSAFANLLMFIASPAAAAMGMTEHPGLGPGEIDLPLAKHCIDLLGIIQQKTRGSLNLPEQQMLEGLLGELRMQYVSLTNARPATAAGPRGFSGSDITGGR